MTSFVFRTPPLIFAALILLDDYVKVVAWCILVNLISGKTAWRHWGPFAVVRPRDLPRRCLTTQTYHRPRFQCQNRSRSVRRGGGKERRCGRMAKQTSLSGCRWWYWLHKHDFTITKSTAKQWSVYLGDGKGRTRTPPLTPLAHLPSGSLDRLCAAHARAGENIETVIWQLYGRSSDISCRLSAIDRVANWELATLSHCDAVGIGFDASEMAES